MVLVLNLLALYADFIATVRSAPEEIHDTLWTLREQILEEREALRQQTLELRDKKAQIRDPWRSRHPAHADRAPSPSSGGVKPSQSDGNLRGDYALSYCEQTLGLHYHSIRVLWRKFKTLERPFLVRGAKAEVARQGAVWGEDDLVSEKSLRRDTEMGSKADSATLYQCDFIHRFIWWQSKKDVHKLSDMVQRVMLRRMEKEVTSCRLMLMNQVRDCCDGPEELASPGFASGGAWNGCRGRHPLAQTRRPSGESSTTTVYESSDESESSAVARGKPWPEKRQPRAKVSEVRQWPSPTVRTRMNSRGDDCDFWNTKTPSGRGRRGQPQIVLEIPQASLPRTLSSYDGMSLP